MQRFFSKWVFIFICCLKARRVKWWDDSLLQMFRWRQQRIHESLDRSTDSGHQWAPGVQMRKLPPPTPFPVTGQSLAGKRGCKMVPDSMTISRHSFVPPGRSQGIFQETLSYAYYVCILWKGCSKMTFEYKYVSYKDHQNHFRVPFSWLVRALHSAWVTSSDKLLAQSRGQCLEERRRCTGSLFGRWGITGSGAICRKR